jgi:PAS domain S-box-containing protein
LARVNAVAAGSPVWLIDTAAESFIMDKPTKVLLIEDSAMDARLLRLFLKEGASSQFEITHVDRLSAGLEKLNEAKFDVVVSDLLLPDSHGIETFETLKARVTDAPIIVLSGSDDETLAVRAVREGAQDYLVKGHIDGHGLVRAITYAIERHRVEQKLISSEAFYHSLVENLPQHILRKDLNERFTFANQRFCNLLGKPLEEIIGKTDFDFFPPQLAEKYQRDDRYVIRTGQTFETVEENQAPSGEKIYVNVIKTPIYDGKGQIIGIQGIFWDITERKRFEERLQKANEELAASEAALRKSHEELKSAQLQLIQAEKMESVGTLAAGVAHEVKNPLAILMMGVNYLTKKLGNAEENIQQVLREMREAIDRADGITRGLLDFSASRQLAIKPEDFNTIIDEALTLVRHELTTKQINVVKHFAEHLPRVGVDKRQIQQVLLNVIINAVHAMPDGGALTVRTYTKQLTETSHYEGSRKAAHFWVGDTAVVAEIEDTGSGIPEENLAKIYDPFFTTKPTGVGTGLGLPVSKKIIELHGGSLDVRNMKAGGVRVTIMLKAQRS